MSSIGPQLPPHIAKRKRTPDDDGAPSSPPSKLPKSSNPNEISLDDDSEDDSYGPSAPAPARPPIGPAMPPRGTKNADEIDLSGSDSDTGPAPATRPPNQVSPKPARPRMGPTMPPSVSANPAEIELSDSDSEPGPVPPPAPKRTFGPSLPPANLSERPPDPASADSDSDDSDDYGPALPSSTDVPPSTERPPPAPEAEAPSKRDDWMLAPPTSTSRRPQDPTKLKNRTFRSGPGAALSTQQAAGADGAPNIWTETAAQKLSRLQNAVLGRGADAPQQQPGSATGLGGGVGVDRQRAQIEEYTAQTRGKSLYDERREARKAGALKGPRRTGADGEEEEDDPSKRPFDKEKDMAIGGRLGAAQKREMMNKAANFGDRFHKGSFL